MTVLIELGKNKGIRCHWSPEEKFQEMDKAYVLVTLHTTVIEYWVKIT